MALLLVVAQVGDAVALAHVAVEQVGQVVTEQAQRQGMAFVLCGGCFEFTLLAAHAEVFQQQGAVVRVKVFQSAAQVFGRFNAREVFNGHAGAQQAEAGLAEGQFLQQCSECGVFEFATQSTGGTGWVLQWLRAVEEEQAALLAQVSGQFAPTLSRVFG